MEKRRARIAQVNEGGKGNRIMKNGRGKQAELITTWSGLKQSRIPNEGELVREEEEEGKAETLAEGMLKE